MTADYHPKMLVDPPFSQRYERCLRDGLGHLGPLPYNQKFPPEPDTTGQHGTAPTPEMLEAWNDLRGCNYYLRVAPDVIVLDVDYKEDDEGNVILNGMATLRALEAELDIEIPAIYVNTRGNPEQKGHIFMRCPKGMHFKGTAGPGIDIVQHTHRYCVFAGSVVDGHRYRFFRKDEDGYREIAGIPTWERLPEAPPELIEYLRVDKPKVVRPASVEVSGDFVDQMKADEREMSQKLYSAACDGVYNTEDADSHVGSSRHDAMLRAIYRVCHVAADGYPGFVDAVEMLRDCWLQFPDKPEREFDRMLEDALRKVAAEYEQYTPRDSYVDVDGVPHNETIERYLEEKAV